MENERTEEQTQETNETQKYLDEIKKLKDSTVSKEKYEKLMEENRNLLNTIVQGREEEEPEEDPVDLEALRKDLFSGKEMTNLDYCRKALALRNETLKQTGKDIFVGQGHALTPTAEAYESAQRVADVMAECIEDCDGDPDVFTARLMARTNDVTLPKSKTKKI